MIRAYIDGYWYYSWEGIKKAMQRLKEKEKCLGLSAKRK